jgi:hypothetical protein
MLKEDKLYVDCACHSPEHLIKFTRFEDEEEVSVYVLLVDYDNFFKRAWKGLKYIFGYKCRYGHFDEIILNKTAQKEIIEYLKNSDHPYGTGYKSYLKTDTSDVK